MSCWSLDPEHRLREVAQILTGYDAVADAVVTTNTEYRKGLVLDVTITAAERGPDTGRVPPRVIETLAQWDLGIADVSTRQSPKHFVLIAF